MDQVYTFTFTFKANGQIRKQTRRVPIAELWQKFNLAADWRREGVPEENRRSEVYGPGLSKVICDEYARRRLREILEPLGLVPIEPEIIGLLWARLAGEDRYQLYKIRKETVELEGYERPHLIHHGLIPVSDDKVDAAFWWSTEKCWRDLGIWINDSPGLIIMSYVNTVKVALQDIPHIVPQLADGQVIRASVRFDYKGRANRYPYMVPTRIKTRINDLRGRYPNATEDLAVVPTSILHASYGYGLPSALSPTPAFAG